MGKPNLYSLKMEFEIDGATSDRSQTQFGIREVTSEINAIGGRAFHINGKNILIRGGGWTPDMMLREDSQRLHDEFRYVRDMGLNTVRLEGKLETQEFFDLADHEGIMVMAGWCCCDFWSAGRAGNRRISRSLSSRSAIRSIACAAIPAWSCG